jgi:hypothetical protein
MSVEGFAEPPAAPYEPPGLVDGRQSETALFIARGLRRMLRAYGYSTITELPLLDGRRADVVALRGDGAILIVEIKSSIADFRADNKWRDYLDHCDKLYFAICDTIPPEMMPLEAGLIIGAAPRVGDAAGGAAALRTSRSGPAAQAGGSGRGGYGMITPLRERGAGVRGAADQSEDRPRARLGLYFRKLVSRRTPRPRPLSLGERGGPPYVAPARPPAAPAE